MLFALADETIVTIIAAIPVMAAAIVSIIIALKTGKKVDAVQTEIKDVKSEVASIQRGLKR